ncbi:MAG: copper amine oxidase N-terminal domain-containing protein [Bacillota bacterium]
MSHRLKGLILLSLLSVLVLAAGVFPANAAIVVTIDGQPLSFGVDASPQIVQGRTLVPLRAIFEALGAQVEWQESTRTVVGTKGGTTIVLRVGQREALKGTERITLDVPAMIISGRTMVPLRFVSEALGTSVSWDGEHQTVSISTQSVQPTTTESPKAEGYFTPGTRLELNAQISPKVDFQVVLEPGALSKAASVKLYADGLRSYRLVIGADVNTSNIPGKKGFDGAQVKVRFTQKWPFDIKRPIILANGEISCNKCYTGKETMVSGAKITASYTSLKVEEANDYQWSQVEIAY